MLEAVLRQLTTHLPSAEFYVVERPGVPSRVWSMPNVRRADIRLLPQPRCPDLKWMLAIPYFWRWRGAGLGILGRRQLARQLKTQECLYRAGNTDAEHCETNSQFNDFCANYDAYFVAGGGNLTDAFLQAIWERCCFIHAFADQEKPVILTGQQLGPFRSRAVRAAMASALRKATFVGVREPGYSMRFCQHAQLATHQYAMMGDDSMGLQRATDSETSDVLTALNLKPNSYIATNLRLAPYISRHESLIRKMSRVLDLVSEHFQLPVLVIPIAQHRVSDDAAVGAQLADRCSADVSILNSSDLTPTTAKAVLANARLAVGTSYHFCTFALTEGVPAVSPYAGDYYRQKANGIATFWQDERLAVSLTTQHANKIANRIIAVGEDKELRAHLRSVARGAMKEWNHWIDHACRVLNSNSGARSVTCSPES
jgi:polysaccharide pyruvyl transferase WcaK-like protein